MRDWVEDAAGHVVYAALYTGPLGILTAGLGLLLIVLLLAVWF